jgi:hypothetical protein
MRKNNTSYLSPEHHLAMAKGLLATGNRIGAHAALRSALTLGLQGLDPQVLEQTALTEQERINLNILQFCRNQPSWPPWGRSRVSLTATMN